MENYFYRSYRNAGRKLFLKDTKMVYAESDIAKIRSFLGNISDTLMEATWFGCCLISTNVGWASELCLSSGRGFIIPNSEPGKQETENIVKQMQDIIDKRVDLTFDAERQISYVRNKYAMSNIVKQRNFKDFFKYNNLPID